MPVTDAKDFGPLKQYQIHPAIGGAGTMAAEPGNSTDVYWHRDMPPRTRGCSPQGEGSDHERKDKNGG